MAYVPPHRRRKAQQQKESSSRHEKLSKFYTAANEAEEENTVLGDSIDIIKCINLESRPDKWRDFQKEVALTRSKALQAKVQRFNAVNGATAGSSSDVCSHWDATINARYAPKVQPGFRTMTAGEIGCALSHIALWRELTEQKDDKTCMMILEDDVVFTKKRGKSRFVPAVEEAWRQLPENGWDLLYLGFSSRGERCYIDSSRDDNKKAESAGGTSPLDVQLYKPEYGFHTHAYIIKRSAAQVLLQNLPIAGPVDVWLADHSWFNLQVFCAIIANEGWKLDDGTYEGAVLVSQNRRQGFKSDVEQSSDAFSTK